MDNSVVNLLKHTNIQTTAPQNSGNKSYWANNLTSKPDSFTKQNASNDNKFTLKEALKNFAKGVFAPIKAIFKKPLLSIGIIATTLVATQFIPVLAPIMAVGFGLLSAFELSKGIYSAVKEYKNGKYDNSEKAFEKIGSGFIGTALTALGIKQTAKIASEAKTMSALNTSDLNILQKNEIAQTISKGTWFNALKENVSILTTKNGLKAIAHQFKPSFLKSRLANIMLGINQRLSPEKQLEKFKKSPEGIRRANLTDEEIQKEIQVVYDKVFDELKIPKEARPRLILKNLEGEVYGEYCAKSHYINVDPQSYRTGAANIEHVIMHEATHCKRALTCAQLPKEQFEKIICDEILNKIQNGEPRLVVYGVTPNGKSLVMLPPKLSPQMRSSFAQFAKDTLLNSKIDQKELSYRVAEFTEEFLAKFPDFIKMHGGDDAKATQQLMNYLLSIPIRKGLATTQLAANVNKGKLALTGISTQDVANSVVRGMDNLEINLINQTMRNTKNPLLRTITNSQYIAAPEEVLCEQAASKFTIQTVLDKIKTLKESGQLTLKKELELLQNLRKEQLIFDSKTFGLKINPIIKDFFTGNNKVAEIQNFLEQFSLLNYNTSAYKNMIKNLKDLSAASANNSGIVLSQTKS